MCLAQGKRIAAHICKRGLFWKVGRHRDSPGKHSLSFTTAAEDDASVRSTPRAFPAHVARGAHTCREMACAVSRQQEIYGNPRRYTHVESGVAEKHARAESAEGRQNPGIAAIAPNARRGKAGLSSIVLCLCLCSSPRDIATRLTRRRMTAELTAKGVEPRWFSRMMPTPGVSHASHGAGRVAVLVERAVDPRNRAAPAALRCNVHEDI
ncbi:hypothetical protein WOLCODRAFT_149303 [Wolfiporia cocos MD-104 SS10]|uniref:Uncharacterized protein n=1 Tax=Wolfiporia cocos (strain MD-104) TaxID=742152 RepID=A0A2H3JP02_WOLCO|nr:hypothetical protein WOLCODRAFT_149303 [Wolfiporia cocos MD-104 SS10]